MKFYFLGCLCHKNEGDDAENWSGFEVCSKSKDDSVGTHCNRLINIIIILFVRAKSFIIGSLAAHLYVIFWHSGISFVFFIFALPMLLYIPYPSFHFFLLPQFLFYSNHLQIKINIYEWPHFGSLIEGVRTGRSHLFWVWIVLIIFFRLNTSHIISLV